MKIYVCPEMNGSASERPNTLTLNIYIGVLIVVNLVGTFLRLII